MEGVTASNEQEVYLLTKPSPLTILLHQLLLALLMEYSILSVIRLSEIAHRFQYTADWNSHYDAVHHARTCPTNQVTSVDDAHFAWRKVITYYAAIAIQNKPALPRCAQNKKPFAAAAALGETLCLHSDIDSRVGAKESPFLNAPAQIALIRLAPTTKRAGNTSVSPKAHRRKARAVHRGPHHCMFPCNCRSINSPGTAGASITSPRSP
jgi:hypothetical protein